jgi:hypothetical protein
MFWIRYQARNGGGALVWQETALRAPTEVDYPEARLLKVQTTQDGAIVIQRPLRTRARVAGSGVATVS